MKALIRRLQRLENLGEAPQSTAAFLIVRHGQSEEDAIREQFGDQPRPATLIILDGVSQKLAEAYLGNRLAQRDGVVPQTSRRPAQ